MRDSELNQVRKLFESEFEKNLFEASLQNLEDKSNKLRFNNFAYSVRELSRHILHNLAPDHEIICCSWYKNETGTPGIISRGERVKYAIQGGLVDSFVDLEIVEIDTINSLKKQINKSINILNKYTHINSSTFNISEKNINEYSSQVLSALFKLAETIKESRDIIIQKIEDKIYDEFITHSITKVIDEIDILATHHEVEEIEPSSFHIIKIESQSLVIKTDGFVSVRLQWGSDSDLRNDIGGEMFTSFPFDCIINVEINKKLEDASISIEKFDVDTSDWYE